jgi:phospholipid/cholesterol/gamma-HCH transport system permease protein
MKKWITSPNYVLLQARRRGAAKQGTAMAGEAWVRTSRDGAGLVLAAGGRWQLAASGALDAELNRLDLSSVRRARFDLSGIETLDTAGAWLLYRTQRRLEQNGATVEIAGAAPQNAALLQRMAPRERRSLLRPQISPLRSLVERVGAAAIHQAYEGRDLLNFFGLVCVTTLRVVTQPGRVRFTSVAAHIEQVGFNAMPIVGLLSFLIGIVLAYQGADQLRSFGAEIYTINLLGISVLREIGVLLTAILIAGRSGSAFTAEIGTMKVNEEVDAMQTLGLDVTEVLVLPRLLAVIIALPLLVFFADMAALAGGALMSTLALDFSARQFVTQLHAALKFSSYWTGLVKAPVFAMLIGLVGCYEGLRVEGGAESVGRMTTKAVVVSIFLVIVADAIFSIMFSLMHI